jgi:hypothetical protein
MTTRQRFAFAAGVGRILEPLRELFEKSTPGEWKVWGNEVESDLAGDSDHGKAVPVARFYAPRTWNAQLTCALRNALPELLKLLPAAPKPPR